MNTPSFIWLIGLLLLSSPAIYIVGRLARHEDGSAPASRWLALVAVLGAWVPYVFAALENSAGGTASLKIGQVALTMDGLGLLLAACGGGRLLCQCLSGQGQTHHHHCGAQCGGLHLSLRRGR